MLTRWSDLDRTISVFDEFQKRMNQLFYEFEPRSTGPRTFVAQTWPVVNYYDAGDDLVILAQVPGLTEKEINLTLNQEVLTISGERKIDVPEGCSVHRQERGNVRFSRSLTFPCKVNPEKTTAKVKDGLLTITLGKAEEAKPRQITIKAQ